MRITLITIALSTFGILLPAYAVGDIECPAMPSAVTQVNRDVRLDVQARVGSLGKVVAGELAAKADVTAKNLFAKYPNVDRILTIQMMASTYCSLLRSSSLTSSERLRRWEQFSSKVFSLQQSAVTSNSSQSRPPVSSHASRPEGHPSASSSSTIRNASRQRRSKEEQLLEASQPAISFVVGQHTLARESVVYLQALARKLRGHTAVEIRLIPYVPREMQAFSMEANELAYKRQSMVRSMLIQAGLPSTRIVFVRGEAYGNTMDEVLDDAGQPIEWGLSVELAKRDA